MYYYGLGVQRDRIEANRLFRQAAAHGDRRAQETLGQNRVRMSWTAKITTALKLLAALFFGMPLLRSFRQDRTRAQKFLAVTALLLLFSFAFDLFYYLAAPRLQFWGWPTALYCFEHGFNGVLVAMLVPIVHPRSAKILLIATLTLLIGFVAFEAFLVHARHFPVQPWFLGAACFPLGMLLPAAIRLWQQEWGSPAELETQGEKV